MEKCKNLLRVAMISLLFLCSGMQVFAQSSCGELYQRANSLRKSKNYAEAKELYRQVLNCGDESFRKDSEKWIKWIDDRRDELELSVTEVRIPYQGGDQKINIKANGKWTVDQNNISWANTLSDDEGLIVQCREQNNSMRERVTTYTIKNGSIFRSLRVIQAAREEYLEVSSQQLSFPSKGAIEEISIMTNANWQVASSPSWAKVEQDGNKIRIIVDENSRTMDREDRVIIITPSSKSVTIKISQGAGDEHLTLSNNNLRFSSEGDTQTVRVYTDAGNWFVGDFPTWCSVQRIDNDNISIRVDKNDPVGRERFGTVQVRTDRQTVGIDITQDLKMPIDVIFPEGSLIGGRNISFGVTAGYLMPMIHASAGSDYVGSVVNYGLGTKDENASYTSQTGFTAGLFADMRLYKNIYLTAGINYTYYSYKNSFAQPINDYIRQLPAGYEMGPISNSYSETYTHSMIEVPIIVSYRFKLNTTSHFQVGLGPVINYGLSAKLKLSGFTDSQTLTEYNNLGQPTGHTGRINSSIPEAEFDLYGTKVKWEELETTASPAPIGHQVNFSSSPFKKLNAGIQLGAAYEISGLSFGLSYTLMLTNMADEGYWDTKRWAIIRDGKSVISGYKHQIHSLQFKIAYTFRYLGLKKK